MSALQITQGTINASSSDLTNVIKFKSSIGPLCSSQSIFKFKANAKSRFLQPFKKSVQFSPPLNQKQDRLTIVRIVDINRNIFHKLPIYRNPNKISKPIFINKKLNKNSMSHLTHTKIQSNPTKYYSNLLNMHINNRRNRLSRMLSCDLPKHIEDCDIKSCSPLSIMGTCITPKNEEKQCSDAIE